MRWCVVWCVPSRWAWASVFERGRREARRQSLAPRRAVAREAAARYNRGMDPDLNRELVELPLDSIHPYANNPRKNDAAVPIVAKSIESCGYVAPIIIDEDNVILAGHTRHRALAQLGRVSAPCMRITGLSEEQKRKYRLLDNKTAEVAEWDWSSLESELAELDFSDLPEIDWGLPEEAPTREAEDAEAPEPPEEPVTQRGDVYELGDHRLMCGDSTMPGDVERLMAGEQADLLLTDPPYNVNYEGGTGLKIMNDSMSNDDFLHFLELAFCAAGAVLRPGAAFYIWHADIESENFFHACRTQLGKVRQCLIWVKNSLVLGRKDYQVKHEPCLYGWTEGEAHTWCGDRSQTTLMEFDKPRRNGEHPTMKPVPLFEYLIANSTKRGDVVLDTFGGSGTTMVAAEQSGRRARLMELDPKYCDVIVARWENLTGRKAVLLPREQ